MAIISLMPISFSQNQAPSPKLCEAAHTQSDLPSYQGLNGWLFHPGDLASPKLGLDSLPYIQRLHEALQAQGIKLVIVNLPTRAMVHHDQFDLNQAFFAQYDVLAGEAAFQQFHQRLEVLGVSAPNLFAPFVAKGRPYSYTFARNSHWNSAGSAFVAKNLAIYLKTLPQFVEIPEVKLKLELVKVIEKKGDLAVFAELACQTSLWENEAYPKYIATKIEPEDLDQSLFAEEHSEIVLWGTSNSEEGFNFRAFLEHELSARIANASISAGGLWSAMEGFFSQPTSKIDYPTIALWEFPFRNVEEFNNLSKYRQVIPMIYGECSAAESLAMSPWQKLRSQAIPLEALEEIRAWRAARAQLIPKQPAPDGSQDAIKLSFDGEANPWLVYSHDLGQILAGQAFTFSVWLWTDESEPKEASLLIYSIPEPAQVRKVDITLTSTPTQYDISYLFSSETTQTALALRIDGLKDPERLKEGMYLYAWQPKLSQENLEIFDLSPLNISGHDYYSYLEMSDKSILNFDLITESLAGEIEVLSVNRPNLIPNSGRYFLEFSDVLNAPVKSLSFRLAPSQKAKGRIRAKLCRVPR
ncbi:MAG: hypothetical protein R2880_02940 [Deinococcales bacterium]